MVTREQVLHVAALAKLTLSSEEEERFRAQLGRILGYVELLQEIEEGADELTHVVSLQKGLRSDEPGECLPQSEALALAPDADDGTIRVPAVIDGGDA